MVALRTNFVTDLSALSDESLSEVTADGHSFSSAEWYRLIDGVNLSRLTGGNVRLAYAVTTEDGRPNSLVPLMRISGRGAYFAYSIRRYYFERWMEELLRVHPSPKGSFARLLTGVKTYKRLLDWSGSPLDDCLIVGSPLALRGHIPVSPSASTPRDRVYGSLLTTLQRYSRRHQVPLWFFGIAGERGRLAKSLESFGCQRAFMFHDNVVELDDYRRFSDYMQSFRRSTRRAFNREIVGTERAGFEFTHTDEIENVADDLADLHARCHTRADDSQVLQPREFWSALGQAFGPRAEAILAHGRNKTLGFHVLIRNERRGEMWTYRAGRVETGQSHDRILNSSLCFYEPIRRAIALGYRRLWLGPASYEAKALRGARQVPVYNYFWFPRHWDRWVLMPYIEQFGEISRQQITRALDRPTRVRAALKKLSRPAPDSNK